MKFLKNCLFQAYGVESIKLVASEGSRFNIVTEMVLFPKIYIKVGIDIPCTQLHPAPYTSTQAILASTQLSATPSTLLEPKYRM